MNEDRLKLSLGLGFEVGKYYIVHPLTIGEIAELGYMELRRLLNIMTLEWDDISLEIPDEEKTDERLYKILRELYYKSDDFFDSFNKACKVLLKRPLTENQVSSMEEKNFERIIDFFTPEVYGRIREVVERQYLLGGKEEKKKEKPKFANERARKLNERIEANRKKAEKYKKDTLDLVDYISSLRWRLGISKKEVLNMTMYELYEGLQRVDLIGKTEHLLSGIYSGSVSVKSINEKETHWMRHIEL